MRLPALLSALVLALCLPGGPALAEATLFPALGAQGKVLTLSLIHI